MATPPSSPAGGRPPSVTTVFHTEDEHMPHDGAQVPSAAALSAALVATARLLNPHTPIAGIPKSPLYLRGAGAGAAHMADGSPLSDAARAVSLGSGMPRHDSIGSCESEELPRRVGLISSHPLVSMSCAHVTNQGTVYLTGLANASTVRMEKLGERKDISVGLPSKSLKSPVDKPNKIIETEDGTLIITNAEGSLAIFNREGNLIFHRYYPTMSSMIYSEGHFFISSTDGSIEVMKRSDSNKWNILEKLTLPPAASSSPSVTSMAYSNNQLFCGREDGSIVCINLTTKTQNILTTSYVPATQPVQHLLFAEGRLFSISGNQINMWRQEGDHYKSTAQLVTDHLFTAMCFGNGHLYCTSDNNQILAISQRNIERNRLTKVEIVELPTRDTPPPPDRKIFPDICAVAQVCSAANLARYLSSGCTFQTYPDPATKAPMIQASGPGIVFTFDSEPQPYSEELVAAYLKARCAFSTSVDAEGRRWIKPEPPMPRSSLPKGPQVYSDELFSQFLASGVEFIMDTDPAIADGAAVEKRRLKISEPLVINPYKRILSMNVATYLDPVTRKVGNHLVIVGQHALAILAI